MNRSYRNTEKVYIKIPVPLPTENEVRGVLYAKQFWREKKYRELLDLFVSVYIRSGNIFPEMLVPFHTKLYSIQSLVPVYLQTIMRRSSRKSSPRLPLDKMSIRK